MDDTVLAVLFWAMLAIGILALAYPWRLESRVARALVHAPLLLPAMFVAYEQRMPPEMNIRIDWLLLGPLFAAAFVCYALRLCRLAAARRRERGRA